MKSINPYTNQVIRDFKEMTGEVVEEIINSSAREFKAWRRSTIAVRSALMLNAASLLRSGSQEYAKAITMEMGKPVKESLAEVEKCAWVCEYYAENAERFLQPEPMDSDAKESYVSFEPLGTVLGIMPWNFPFWQVFRFAVPPLMAGNCVLLKHASNVQICAENIESIFRQAGFPNGAFRNLVISSSAVEEVIRHDSIRAVSLTGSDRAGEKVAAAAGSVLKKCVLELGGSNAFIVLGDADIANAVETGIKARFQNAGQSCIAAKRFILDREIASQFIDLFTSGVRKLVSGDPMMGDTDIGPMAGIEHAIEVEKQVNRSVAMGARILEGGSRNGAFYQPSVVTDVKPGMPLFDEEVFGPVAAITVVDNYGEAIALSNRSNFGLGVSLFTGNLDMAHDLAGEFDDGAVFINGLVKSDPRLPFGGTKRSGYGRELSVYGIREFVNAKTVWTAWK